MKLVDIITGTRPNVMKVAPIIHRLQEDLNNGGLVAYRLIHTGQHFDREMYGVFLQDLQVPQPDVDLEVGYCGTTEEQLEAIIHRYEQVLAIQAPDMVLVVGDCTSTLGCALAIKKFNKDIPLAHVEAGIRCGDIDMPEELNRVATDAISDYFFTTSIHAGGNLIRCGIAPERIFFAGNTMIDTLLAQLNNLERPAIADALGLKDGGYFLMTLHRRANIQSAAVLLRLIRQVMTHVQDMPVVFPLHPHTAQQLPIQVIGYPNLHITDPMRYPEFNYLVSRAKAVITDSGGVSEETTVLGIPCITLRTTTERPETCSVGSNVLVGTSEQKIREAFERLFAGQWKPSGIPARWDGKAAERIVRVIGEIFRRQERMAQGPESSRS